MLLQVRQAQAGFSILENLGMDQGTPLVPRRKRGADPADQPTRGTALHYVDAPNGMDQSTNQTLAFGLDTLEALLLTLHYQYHAAEQDELHCSTQSLGNGGMAC